MTRFTVLLPVLLALLVGAEPALAWTWPADGPVLQPFTYNNDPYGGGQHRGIDIGASSGTGVVAPRSGIVTFAGAVPGGGRTVTISTEDGYSVTLLHLGVLAVARGNLVGEGDVVAGVGPSGEPEVAGPYVHLGVRWSAEPDGYVDPLDLLPRRSHSEVGETASDDAGTGAVALADEKPEGDAVTPAPAEPPAGDPVAREDSLSRETGPQPQQVVAESESSSDSSELGGGGASLPQILAVPQAGVAQVAATESGAPEMAPSELERPPGGSPERAQASESGAAGSVDSGGRWATTERSASRQDQLARESARDSSRHPRRRAEETSTPGTEKGMLGSKSEPELGLVGESGRQTQPGRAGRGASDSLHSWPGASLVVAGLALAAALLVAWIAQRRAAGRVSREVDAAEAAARTELDLQHDVGLSGLELPPLTSAVIGSDDLPRRARVGSGRRCRPAARLVRGWHTARGPARRGPHALGRQAWAGRRGAQSRERASV